MAHDTAAVTLDGVRVGYPGHVVLDDATAHFPAHRTTAIVGPNGAGKSTLLDAVAGMRPVLAGSITYARHVRPAYVVQSSAVSDTLPITVRGTVEMGRWSRRGPWRRLTAEDRRIVDDCLERLGLTALAHRGIGTLSGGQRQRTLLAQGLAQQAELLLLDEPAAGLDVHAQRLIEDALEAVRAGGATIVRITHDLRSARRADHCLVLSGGRVVATGAPDEALRAGAMELTGLAPGPVSRASPSPRS